MVEPKAHHQVFDFHNCAVIAAHPDDETLWAGGTILMHPESKWTIVTLCRASDRDRAPKFSKALERLNAVGQMGDLDDGPEQLPLPARDVQNTIMSLLPSDRFDLVITHGLWGEYTRHLRHEEAAKAVMALRERGRLSAKELRMFAYQDAGGKHLPRPNRDADVMVNLPEEIWQAKYDIIRKIYGFDPESFEARTTPKQEAFWRLGTKK
jgi:LmbE family N-acetylglucosaminyl deacetylase